MTSPYARKRARASAPSMLIEDAIEAERVPRFRWPRGASMYPMAQYGRTYSGPTDASLAKYGKQWASATVDQRDSRQRDKYYGRGLYEGRGRYGTRYKGKGVFFTAATALAAAKAAPAVLGAIGAVKKFITGKGQYTHSNSLVTSGDGGVSMDVPSFKSTSDETGALTITHREYVRDVFGNEVGENFKNRSLPINPGLEQTFPWLSQIAQNYEEYDLKQCIFSYRSTVSDVATTGTNGQIGTVIMATNYNPSNLPWANKNVMMQYDGAHSAKTTESQLQGVECDPKKLSATPGKYIRTNPVENNRDDLKFYDHGLFQLASCGLPAEYSNATIGELWISYTVTLRKPKFFTALGLGISRDIFYDQTAMNTRNSIPTLFDANTLYTGDVPLLMNAATNALALRGQRNNIGVKIVTPAIWEAKPSVVDGNTTAHDIINNCCGFTVLFPAYVAGTYEIKLRARAGPGASTSEQVSVQSEFIRASGNIVFVNDMYSAWAQAPTTNLFTGQILGGGDTPNVHFASASAPNQNIGSAIYIGKAVSEETSVTYETDSQMTCTIHIRVQVATNGFDNRIFIPIIGEDTDAPEVSPFNNIVLDISEYNHYSNEMAPPIYENSTGIQTLPILQA